MKARTRKLLSLLLTLCMVIGLLPAMALTAAAASDDPYVTVNNNVFLTAAKPYYVNGKAQAADPGDATFGSNGYTAKLKLSGNDATLTLKNYNGGRISYRYGNLTVVVNGSNVIDSPNSEGLGASGNLTVKGGTDNKVTDSLTITSANGCIRADGNLTIQDLKELNCSSTAVYNNCVKSSGALTLQNIGTARISLPNVGGGYAALLGQTSLTVTSVDDLEVSCGGDCVYSSSSAFGAISITAAKAALYSKGGNAICNYGGDVTVEVGTLIAVTDGGIAIRAANYSNTSRAVTASVTASAGLYIKGAVTQQATNNPTVKVNENAVEKTNGVYSGTSSGSVQKTEVNINISYAPKAYDGEPISLTVTAEQQGGSATTEDLTYLYAWYDSANHLMGSTVPVDAGTYYVIAYGYSDHYQGKSAKTQVEITKGDVPDEWKSVSANITNGNNLITLPEIPSGMSFGAPVRCEADGSALSAPDGVTLTPTLSGNLLSVQAKDLPSSGSGDYYVKVPVTGTNCNYKDYNIILTLTNLTGMAIFDRCDGSGAKIVDLRDPSNIPDTELYSAKAGSGNPDGAWQAAIGNAIMYGYEFAGWYTAPNGWGLQVSDADGTVPGESADPAVFTAGTTYYAKWVWTCSYVSYDVNDYDVYGDLSKPRTVYTTCLDFTNAEKLGIRVGGDGYDFDGASKTLTLDGVHIQALDSVCGIILPAGSKIEVVSMTGGTKFKNFRDGSGNQLSSEAAEKYADYHDASNIISCGSLDATADVLCKGNLTIHSDASNFKEDGVGLGNWLDVKQGGIKTAANGTLTVQNANIGATRLHADGDIMIGDSMIFATNYSSTFTGDRYVRSYNGSVTIDQGWVFTDWLQAATDLSISGAESRIRARFGASAGETISISGSGYKQPSGSTYNFALDFGDQENALWGLYAKNINISGSLLNSSSIMTGDKLTVSGGSEVNAHSSQTALPISIYGGGSISNSTVNVTEVVSNSVGIYGSKSLSINSSTVKVSAAENATPLAAILVSGVESDPGLVVNSSVLTSPSGYSLQKLVLVGEDEAYWSFVEDSLLSMAGEVTISPVVYVDDTPVSYPVTAPKETEGGSVAVSPKNAAKGKTVTLTVTADEGYELDSITVTDRNGKELPLTDAGDGKFTFTMPAGKVEISASFKAVEPEPVGPAYEDFSDLERGTWYEDGVAYVLEQGLMNGIGDGVFDPTGETSRAMVAAILWRLADCPEAGAEGTFTDVPAGTWYTDAADWAAETGIANGYNGAFDPEGAITREQLACMLYRFAQSQGKGFTGEWMFPLDYTDAGSVSDWAYEAMCWMTMNGVINGKSGSVLDPHGMATRAETAAMLLRFAESMK